MRKLTLLIVVCLFLSSALMQGQVATGLYNLGTYDSREFDTVNLGNLNVHFEIPIFSKVGRGGLDFQHSLVYDSSIWTPTTIGTTKTWQPVQAWGWLSDTLPVSGNLTFFTGSTRCFDTTPAVFKPSESRFVYTEPSGVMHYFDASVSSGGGDAPGVQQCDSGAGVPSSQGGTLTTSDGSGLVVVVNGWNNYQIRYSTGKLVKPTYNYAPSTTSITDDNGNLITTTFSGTTTTMKDTTGTNVITLTGGGTSSSPRLITYPTWVSGASSTASVTVYYTSYNIHTAFACSGISEYTSTSTVDLVDHVQMPDGQTYTFTYEPTPGTTTGQVTGRLASIQLPYGGHINYSYSGGSNGVSCQDGSAVTLTRTLPDDSVYGMVYPRIYTRTPGSGAIAVGSTTHTDVTDGYGAHSTYDFIYDALGGTYAPYVISDAHYSGAVSGTPVLAEQTYYCCDMPSGGHSQTSTLSKSSTDTVSTFDGIATTEKIEGYTSWGQPSGEGVYNFGSGSPGTSLASQGCNTVSLNPGNISRLASCGNRYYTETYSYDGEFPTTQSLPQFSPPNGVYRGNLTAVTYTLSPSAPTIPPTPGVTIVASQMSHDDAGQTVASKDAAGNQTSFAFDSATDALPTSVTLPTTSSITHTTSTNYDVTSGVLKSSTDLNTVTTTFSLDSLLRQIESYGTGIPHLTNSYSLAGSGASTTSSVQHVTGGAVWESATTSFDAYGRKQFVTSSDTPSADIVEYKYDRNGRSWKVSNPYRASDTTHHFTTYTYDALDRVYQVTRPDESSVFTTWWHAVSNSSFVGQRVTITDEVSKTREIYLDGLGRPAKVFEPNSSGVLALETDYAYDQNVTLGDPTHSTTYQTIITQKGQSTSSSDWRVRTFTYDALGRTISETTPEAGTTTYSYPLLTTPYCSGDLTQPCSRTDALGTNTTYSYDALNRLTGKTYSGSSIGLATPAVSYIYDQGLYNGLSIANGNGMRVGMSDASGMTAWSYYPDGTVAKVKKSITVGGSVVTKEADMAYNADGTPLSVQTFDGASLTYSDFDAAGRARQLADASHTYAQAASFTSAGQLSGMTHQLTSGSASYQRSLQYTPDTLMPSVISATVNNGTTSTIQSLSYGYAAPGANNGNLASISNGLDATRSQSFTYDELNRIKQAKDVGHWGEGYGYDDWGNLNSKTALAGYAGTSWSATPDSHNQVPGLSFTYDAAGQVTQDRYGNSYTYDAEGRILTGGSGTYIYDGDGNRVSKTVAGAQTLYWPEVLSIAELSDSSATTFAKQVSLAGLQVWSEDLIGNGNFVFQDHLGSVRITADASGNLKNDFDYTAFGNPMNYGSPASGDITFAGYESDVSQTDSNYAVFRNYHSEYGRFNRPDPYDGSYNSFDPQSLNRYAYVGNRPLSFIDPTGLVYLQIGDCVYDAVPTVSNTHRDGPGKNGTKYTFVGCLAGNSTGRGPVAAPPVGTHGSGTSLTKKQCLASAQQEHDDFASEFQSNDMKRFKRATIGLGISGFVVGCAFGAAATSPTGPGAIGGCIIGGIDVGLTAAFFGGMGAVAYHFVGLNTNEETLKRNRAFCNALPAKE